MSGVDDEEDNEEMQRALGATETMWECSRGYKLQQIALATLCTAMKSMQQRWAHKQVRPNTTLNQTTLYCASTGAYRLAVRRHREVWLDRIKHWFQTAN